MNSVADRIKKVFSGTNADVIFLINTDQQDSNFIYLTGFTSGVFEGTPLIVTRKRLVLPCSILEYEIAKEQRPKEMSIVKIDSRKRMIALMKKYMKSKMVGVNGSFIPYSYYNSLKKNALPKRIIDVTNAFVAARSVKERYEILNIKIANRIAKQALEEVKASISAGMTEKEVAAMIEYSMMKRGASGASFRSIVSFNANAALPHHMPDNTRLTPNSIVLMDIGAKYNNYCSDITRTFMFEPDRSSERYRRFSEMHRIVEGAQQTALRFIKEGADGSAAHNAASDYINSAFNGKYKGRFIHSLGHALGLEVHDPGTGLSERSGKLMANMVVSNEPGIYVVGFGGVRIEDDVVVTRTGAITL